MITIICIKNPFIPSEGREMHKISYTPNKPVSWYLEPYLNVYVPLSNDNISIFVNSYPSDFNHVVKDGDYIVLSPYIGTGGHGKNPLLIVASIALTVGAMYVGGLAAGGALATATGSAAVEGYLAAAAVMYLGGTLINRLFGTTVDSTSNPTYSWDGISTTSGQGYAIPITYGTVKTGGQTLNKFVMIYDDDQYLYWLLSGGEGYCEISNIQINSNPIGYYEDVSYDIRKGLYNQAVIQNFNDTVSTISLSEELLTTDWRTYELSGNANQGLIIQVECTNGLYYADDDGSLDTEWVSIKAQYCVTGSNNWITFVDEKITGAQTSALRKQYRVDNLTADSYTVRVMVTGRGADVGSTRAQTRIWWTSVSGIVYDDFSYPGICLVGIKGLATNQLSGSPTVTFYKTRSTVLVYDTDTSAYVEKDATNPAWAAYDMLHRAIDINGDKSEIVVTGVPADMILYDKFLAWATFCDTKNLKINIEINTAEKMLETINKNIAAVGLGVVLMFGVKFGCVFDAVVDAPVQLFGMGNIIEGSFQEKFLQTSDRANAVEVTFTNKDKDYERDTVTVYAEDYDDASQYNKSTSVTMDGIATYAHAYRYGKFQLACNEKLLRTCSWDAAIDAIACNVGDVVACSHDVPEWACSGRITAVSGSQVTIGTIFDNYDSTASYQFQYRSSASDSIHLVPVSSITTTNENIATYDGENSSNSKDDIEIMIDGGDSSNRTNDYIDGGDSNGDNAVGVNYDSDEVTVTLSSVPTEAPAVGDICDIAKTAIGSKWFTVKTINRSNDGEYKRTISALEYNADVFNEDYDIPNPDYSTEQSDQAQNVIHVSAKQIYWVSADGTAHSHLYATWSLPTGARANTFSIYLSKTNITKFNKVMETTSLSCDFDTTPNTSYKLKIVTRIGVSQSSGTITEVDAAAGNVPSDLSAFSVTYLNGNYVFSWKKANDSSENEGYEIRKGTTWDSGQLVIRAVGKDVDYAVAQAVVGTVKFFCKPYNGAGYSENAVSDSITIDVLPSIKTLYSKKRFEQLCTVSDSNGVVTRAFSYQKTNVTYAGLAAMTYATMKSAPFVGTPLGNTVLLGPIVTLDVLAQAYISIKEHWIYPPDTSVVYEIATSLDGVTFGDFKLLGAGKIPMKAFQLRITLAGSSIAAILEHLDVEVNASQTTINYSNITIPQGGLTLTYSQSFAQTPAVIVSPNADALIVKKINLTVTGCTIYLLDYSSGTDVGGTADVVIVGT